MTTPTFGAPLVVNDDWTPYTNGDDYYADIDSYSLPCLARSVGGRILAVYENTTPDTASQYGESGVVQARFLTVDPSTLDVVRSAACDVVDYRTRNTATKKWGGSNTSWVGITPVLGDAYAVVTLRPEYRHTDVFQWHDEIDLVLLDLTGATPVVVDTVSIPYTDLDNRSSPTTGRAWDDVIVVGIDLEHYPTGSDPRSIAWRAYPVSPAGFGTPGADTVEAYGNWCASMGASDTGVVLAALDGVLSGGDVYRILTVDHTSLAVTSVPAAAVGGAYTDDTDNSAVHDHPAHNGVITGWSGGTYEVTTDGTGVALAHTAAHPIDVGRDFWYHYSDGPSVGRAYDATGKLWALYTTEGPSRADTSVTLVEDLFGTPVAHPLLLSTLTGGVYGDAGGSWGLMCSTAFAADGTGVLFLGPGDVYDQEAAAPYGKYVAVGFAGPAPPVPPPPLCVNVQQAVGSGSDTDTVTATLPAAATVDHMLVAGVAVRPTPPGGGGGGWQPTDEPGLLLWLNPACLAADHADGDPVATWPDQSGNGNDATGFGSGAANRLYYAAGGMAGGPRINVTNYAGFSFADFMSSLTEGEVVASLRSATAGLNGDLWKFGTDGDGYGTWYPYSDGNVYDGWGSDTRRSYAPGGDVTAWHVFGVASGPGHYEAFRDGTSVYSTASNTVAFRTDPVLFLYGSAPAGQPWSGDCSGILIYDHVLDPDVRAQAVAFLQAAPTCAGPPTPPAVTVTSDVIGEWSERDFGFGSGYPATYDATTQLWCYLFTAPDSPGGDTSIVVTLDDPAADVIVQAVEFAMPIDYPINIDDGGTPTDDTAFTLGTVADDPGTLDIGWVATTPAAFTVLPGGWWKIADTATPGLALYGRMRVTTGTGGPVYDITGSAADPQPWAGVWGTWRAPDGAMICTPTVEVTPAPVFVAPRRRRDRRTPAYVVT